MLRNVESLGEAVRASGEESVDMVVPRMKVREFYFTEATKFLLRILVGSLDRQGRLSVSLKMASKWCLYGAMLRVIGYPIGGRFWPSLS